MHYLIAYVQLFIEAIKTYLSRARADLAINTLVARQEILAKRYKKKHQHRLQFSKAMNELEMSTLVQEEREEKYRRLEEMLQSTAEEREAFYDDLIKDLQQASRIYDERARTCKCGVFAG